MKKKTVLFVILLLTLFGIGILAGKYLLFTPPTLLLIKETAPVYYKTDGQEKYLEFTGDSLSVPFKTSIKTEAGGRAYLIWKGNNLLALDENSEVLTTSPSDFLIYKGTGWFHLEDQSSLKINTPDLLVSGATKDFLVGISKSGLSNLVVIEGEIQAGSYMMTDKGATFIQNELVNKGEMLQVGKDLFNKQAVSEEESSSYWYRRVMLLKDKVDLLKNLELEFYQEIVKKIEFILADLQLDNILGLQITDPSVQVKILKTLQAQLLNKNWGSLQCQEINLADLQQAQFQLLSQLPANRKIAVAISAFLNYLDFTSGVCDDQRIASEESETADRLNQEAVTQISLL